jgi:preprotein translocase subunit YajC
MAIAGVCILLAALLMWGRDFNTAFIVAVIGVIAWFLNYRSQMKSINTAADAEKDLEVDETDEQT